MTSAKKERIIVEKVAYIPPITIPGKAFRAIFCKKNFFADLHHLPIYM